MATGKTSDYDAQRFNEDEVSLLRVLGDSAATTLGGKQGLLAQIADNPESDHDDRKPLRPDADDPVGMGEYRATLASKLDWLSELGRDADDAELVFPEDEHFQERYLTAEANLIAAGWLYMEDGDLLFGTRRTWEWYLEGLRTGDIAEVASHETCHSASTQESYAILPPLLPDEFEALKASIAQRGVDVPIIVDQEGNIIDGYHRQRACDDLGIFCPREVRHFESETDKLELALSLNCGRRQLNRKQKRSVIEAYLLRDPQIADNFLAEIIGGVSKNTVAAVRGELEGTCQIDKFEVLRGRDGRQRPVRYKKIIVDTPEKLDVACKLVGDLPESSVGHFLDVVKARREIEREIRRRDPHDFFPTPGGVTQALLQVEQFSQSVWEPCCGDGVMSEVLKDAGYDVVSTDLIDRGYGEIEDFLTSDRTVANIITNPPYTKHRAEAFVRKALACTTGKVAMFLPLTFLASERREWVIEESCLMWVYIFADRVSLYKGGADNRGNGQVAYAWFVWKHGYDGPPMLGRVHSGRNGVLLGPLDECDRTPPIPLEAVGADLPVNRPPELIKELCIHIEEAHELGRKMDTNVLLSELSNWESVPFPILKRLVKELPDEVRRV